MSRDTQPQVEKLLQSQPTLESEINTARINALELKLDTLSIISEAMWEIIKANGLDQSADLKTEMAKVIDKRNERSGQTINCSACGSVEQVISGICSQCATPLQGGSEISPFDY